ncbi:MAG: Ig-like domain-containing protein [Coraliomargaritaceae bacterium]
MNRHHPWPAFRRIQAVGSRRYLEKNLRPEKKPTDCLLRGRVARLDLFVRCRRLFVASCSFFVSLSAQTAPGDFGWPENYPAWWYKASAPDSGFIDATLPELNVDNKAPLSVGQLQHIAAEAREELAIVLAPVGGAGTAIDTLVGNFSVSDPSRLALAAIGQLKSVSAPFFDRFAEVGFAPGDPGWPPALILDAGEDDPAPRYPWLHDTGPDSLAPAAIGQAKHLFSWDLRSWVAEDSENSGIGDGLPDWWEIYHFGNLQRGPDDDPDGDGMKNALEYAEYCDPENADTDGDGMEDMFEHYYKLQPISRGLSARSSDSDLDNDGRSNLEEFRVGSLPHSAGERLAIDSELQLKWFGVRDRIYRIDYTSDLNAAEWSAFGTDRRGDNAEILVSIRQSLPRLPTMAFFRLHSEAASDPSLPNQAPTIQWIAPSIYRYFILGAKIALEVEASDADGSVEKVEYSVNQRPVTTVSGGNAYASEWTSNAVGEIRISAVAIDDDGARSTAATQTIHISVDSEPDGLPDAYEQAFIERLANDDDPENNLQSIEQVLPGGDAFNGYTHLETVGSGRSPLDPDYRKIQSVPSYGLIDLGATQLTETTRIAPLRVTDNGRVLFQGQQTEYDSSAPAPSPRVWSPGTGFQILPQPGQNDADYDVVDMNENGYIVGRCVETYTVWTTHETYVPAGERETYEPPEPVASTDESIYPVVWKITPSTIEARTAPWAATVPATTEQPQTCDGSTVTVQTEAHKTGVFYGHLTKDNRYIVNQSEDISYPTAALQTDLCTAAVRYQAQSAAVYKNPVIADKTLTGAQQPTSPILRSTYQIVAAPDKEILDFSTGETTLYSGFQTAQAKNSYFFNSMASRNSSQLLAARQRSGTPAGLQHTVLSLQGETLYTSADSIAAINDDGCIVHHNGKVHRSGEETRLGGTHRSYRINNAKDGQHSILARFGEQLWLRNTRRNTETETIEPATPLGFSPYSISDLLPKSERSRWTNFRLTSLSDNGHLCGTATNEDGQKRAVWLLKVEAVPDRDRYKKGTRRIETSELN